MKVLSRQKLESMATQDLIDIANQFGLDFPDDFNRVFIIGEILASQAEMEETEVKELDINSESGEMHLPSSLPTTYNNTTIDAVPRNPVSLFVFWDIKESDIASLSRDSSFENVFVHISFFDTIHSEEPCDSLDMDIPLAPGEQYIMIPSGKKAVKIDLAVAFSEKNPDVLASTRMIAIPTENEKIRNCQPGKKLDFPPLVMLSGMKCILHDSFLNHRQSFSN